VLQVGWDEDAEADVFAGGIVFLEYLAEGVDAREGLLFGEGDSEVEFGTDGFEAGAQFGEQFIESFAGAGRDGYGALEEAVPALEGFAVGEEVDLVEHHEGRAFRSPDFGEDAMDGADLFLGVGMADVDDMEEEIGFDDFLEGGLEGFDEAVGKLADESDGVAEEDVLVGGEAEATGGGIESGEEFILGEHGGAGEGVKEGGLAGIGVADNGGEGPLVALAAVALGQALASDDVEFVPDPVDLFLGLAAVGFELGFAFTTDGAEAAALAGEVGPIAGQAREQVLELGEFDLELAFAGAGALTEDLEDERGPVEDLASEDFLEVAGLGAGEFVVEDDCVDTEFLAAGGELGGLAGADAGRGVGRFELLGSVSENDGTHGGGEFAEFVQGIADIPGGAGLEFEADEECAFGAAICCFYEGFQRKVGGGYAKCG